MQPANFIVIVPGKSTDGPGPTSWAAPHMRSGAGLSSSIRGDGSLSCVAVLQQAPSEVVVAVTMGP